MNWRIHAITFAILVFTVGAFKLVWDHPEVILYLILGAISIVAYGALYIIVRAKMANKDPK